MPKRRDLLAAGSSLTAAALAGCSAPVGRACASTGPCKNAVRDNISIDVLNISFAYSSSVNNPGDTIGAVIGAYNEYEIPTRVIADAVVVGPHNTVIEDAGSRRQVTLDPQQGHQFQFELDLPEYAPDGEYDLHLSGTISRTETIEGEPNTDRDVLESSSSTQTYSVGSTNDGGLPPGVQHLTEGVVDGGESLLEHVKDFGRKPYAGLLGVAYGLYDGALNIVEEIKSLLLHFWEYIADTIRGAIALITNGPWKTITTIFNQFLSNAQDYVPDVYSADQENAFITGFVLGILVFKVIKWYLSKRVNTGKVSDMGDGVKKLFGDNSRFNNFADDLFPDGQSTYPELNIKLELEHRWSLDTAIDRLDEFRSRDLLPIPAMDELMQDLRFMQAYSDDLDVLDVRKQGVLGEALYFRRKVSEKGMRMAERHGDTWYVPDEAGRYVIPNLDLDAAGERLEGIKGEFDTVVVRVDDAGNRHLESISEVKTGKNINIEPTRRKLERGIRKANDVGVKANIPVDEFVVDDVFKHYVGPKNVNWPSSLPYDSTVFNQLFQDFRDILRAPEGIHS
ncbi:hypothetical protein EFA46_015360 (plasmid) [Halarchaeum sp. CBA1220]|uniref:hypothetical protein n=1 Tax=Halarchaeum sp. CBA1220 TaxID=1853682 RepID=UPI0011CE6B18|nr:hypothetical protein [Halarchaeum sp. CBA1220]QLC35637.1 hypothetical protein EFA46_015360 [Halarchaeum sp. CBA1220]